MKGNPTSTPAICSNNNGTASVNPTGGFPPYNVYWFDMNGFPVNPDSLYDSWLTIGITDGDYNNQLSASLNNSNLVNDCLSNADKIIDNYEKRN